MNSMFDRRAPNRRNHGGQCGRWALVGWVPFLRSPLGARRSVDTCARRAAVPDSSTGGSIDASSFRRADRRRACGGRAHWTIGVRAGARARRCSRRTVRSTTSPSPRPAASARSRRCAGASSMISTAAPARAMRLQFRQVSEIDSGEGKVALSDLQATTWEDGDAKTFRFNSKNTVNDRIVDSVNGNAERSPSEVEVKLNKPDEKKLDLAAKIVFPTEHMRRIIDAAKEGKTLLELPVYDGSENGQKTYSTLTVIGKEIPPDEKKPDDAAADKAALAQAAALAGHHQLFRAGRQERRAASGLCDRLRAVTRTASPARCRWTTAISSCRATCPSSTSRTPRPASECVARRVGKGASCAVPTRNGCGGHASLCPPYGLLRFHKTWDLSSYDVPTPVRVARPVAREAAHARNHHQECEAPRSRCRGGEAGRVASCRGRQDRRGRRGRARARRRRRRRR